MITPKHVGLAISLAFMAGSLVAAAARASELRPCTQDDLYPDSDIAWPQRDDVRPGPMPHILVHTGPDIAVEAGVLVRIDEAGKAVCSRYPEDFDNGLYRMKMPRKALNGLVASWRYTPYQVDGKGVPAIIYEPVIVERAQASASPMPIAPLFSSRIDLGRSGCLGSCPSYHVTLTGDGKIRFEGLRYTGLDGAISYSVSPGDVAALIERLRSRGLWNVHEGYWGAQTDARLTLLTLRVGGQTRRIFDYLGESAEMPAAVTTTEDEIDAIAGSNRWIHMTRDSVAELERLGFDFTSAQAGRTLSSMIFDIHGDESAMIDMIQRGVPVRDVAPRDHYDTYIPALPTAVQRGHFALVPLLIERGALSQDGKTDMNAVNEAFQASVETANLSLIRTFLAYHPNLIYTPERAFGEDTFRSVLFLLPDKLYDEERASAERGDIEGALRLLVNAGADPHGQGQYKETLLHHLASTTPAIVRYLLGLGLEIDAKDEFGNTPILDSFDEDTALALLEAGANPMALNDEGRGIWYRARELSWTRVPVWLEAHGFHRPETL